MSKKQGIGGGIFLIILIICSTLYYFEYWGAIFAFLRAAIAGFALKFIAKIFSMGAGGIFLMLTKRFAIDILITPFLKDNLFKLIKYEINLLAKYYIDSLKKASPIKKLMILLTGGPFYLLYKFLGTLLMKLSLNKVFSFILIIIISTKEALLSLAGELVVPLLEFLGVWILLDFLETLFGEKYQNAKRYFESFLTLIAKKLNLRLTERLHSFAEKFKVYVKSKVGDEVYEKFLVNVQIEAEKKEKEKAEKKTALKEKIDTNMKTFKKSRFVRATSIVLMAYALLNL